MATTASPARRRAPRKGDIREQRILDTLERLLEERPLADLNVEDLAAGAGISRAGFYFYFASKHAALQALVERIADDMYRNSDPWFERQPGEEDPERALRAGIGTAASVWREHAAVLRAAVQSWATVPEMRRTYEQVVGRFVERAQRYIEEDRRAGLALPGPPSARALATSLVWMNERAFYVASLDAQPSLGDRDMVQTLSSIWARSIYGN